MKKKTNDFLNFFYIPYKNRIKTFLKFSMSKYPNNSLSASNIEWETKECEVWFPFPLYPLFYKYFLKCWCGWIQLCLGSPALPPCDILPSNQNSPNSDTTPLRQQQNWLKINKQTKNKDSPKEKCVPFDWDSNSNEKSKKKRGSILILSIVKRTESHKFHKSQITNHRDPSSIKICWTMKNQTASSQSTTTTTTPTPPPKPATTVLPYQTPRLREHYKIGEKLGQGQFGTTYLCTHKTTGALYACKSIPKRKLLCKEDYEDVWREIQIMHHLSEHPNVVQIKGTYEDSLFVHLVMELCGGGELFDRIVQKGQYSEKEAAKLIKTIVGVVEACHSLGVMHRDLKPENFLFDSPADDASLKATDFGLSVFYKPGSFLGFLSFSLLFIGSACLGLFIYFLCLFISKLLVLFSVFFIYYFFILLRLIDLGCDWLLKWASFSLSIRFRTFLFIL